MAYNADTMSFELPDTDTVYVSGLPTNITEKDIEEYFGSIGVIKTDKKTRGKKIWLYRDKASGSLKGDGTVSYEDPFSAASAVEWFNQKEWKGSMLSVSLAERKGAGGGYGGGGDSYGGSRGGGGGFDDSYNAAPPPSYGGGGGGGGPAAGGGDWLCGSCGNNNFARRDKCHRCQAPRPDAGGGGGGGGGSYGGGAAYNGGGGGGGFSAPSGGKPGDWSCPRCGNHNFARRDSCQKCQMSKAEAAGGGGGGGAGGGYQQQGGGAGYGSAPAAGGGYDAGGAPAGGDRGGDRSASAGSDRGGSKGKVVAAPQGPAGLFAPGDWACASCGNTNWERRSTCNLCGAPKPGSVDVRREGQGGGFKELDEQELEESRRRRQQYRQGGDDEEYDEWGRLKRKKAGESAEDKRAREQAALARLYGGSNLAPSEVERSGGYQQPERGEPDYNRGSGGGRERERSPAGGDRDRRGGGGGYGDRDRGAGGGGDRGGDRGEYRGGGGRDYDRDRKDRPRDDRGRGGRY